MNQSFSYSGVCILLFLAVSLLLTPPTLADEEQVEHERGGSFKGIVLEKSDTWIRVRPDGNEEWMRLTPHWRGGMPADGGGLDERMLKAIDKTPVGSRVAINWVWEERPRVTRLQILEMPREEVREREQDGDREHSERDTDRERDREESREGDRPRDDHEEAKHEREGEREEAENHEKDGDRQRDAEEMTEKQETKERHDRRIDELEASRAALEKENKQLRERIEELEKKLDQYENLIREFKEID